jgi:hypothetical protein
MRCGQRSLPIDLDLPDVRRGDAHLLEVKLVFQLAFRRFIVG